MQLSLLRSPLAAAKLLILAAAIAASAMALAPRQANAQGIVLYQDTIGPQRWVRRIMLDTTGFAVRPIGYQFSMGTRYDQGSPLPPVWMPKERDVRWSLTIVRCTEPPRWRLGGEFTTVESAPDDGHPQAALAEACRHLVEIAKKDSADKSRRPILSEAQLSRAREAGFSPESSVHFLRPTLRGFDLRPAEVAISLPFPTAYVGARVDDWLIHMQALGRRVTCDGDLIEARCSVEISRLFVGQVDQLGGKRIAVTLSVRDSVVQQVTARYDEGLLRSGVSRGLDRRTIDVISVLLGEPRVSQSLTVQQMSWRDDSTSITRSIDGSSGVVTWTWSKRSAQ